VARLGRAQVPHAPADPLRRVRVIRDLGAKVTVPITFIDHCDHIHSEFLPGETLTIVGTGGRGGLIAEAVRRYPESKPTEPAYIVRDVVYPEETSLEAE
jgi:hypothetical protein